MTKFLFILFFMSLSSAYAFQWALEDHPQLPPSLHQTGIYHSDSEFKISKELYPFKPQYPLWTDGAVKYRYAYVPQGKQIDTLNMNDWQFPEGTIFWKEFNFKNIKVETRVIALTKKGWLYGSYKWNKEQTTATLVSESGAKDVAPIGYYKLGKELMHDIPTKLQCKACHNLGKNMILGFDALQLSDDQNSNNGPFAHDTQLTVSTLVKNNLLTHAPKKPESIKTDSDLERRALGYLHGNCGNCHRPTGAAQHTKLFFRHEMASKSQTEPAIETTVHKNTLNYALPGLKLEQTYRLVPGSPALSALWFRMNSRHIKHQMPKIGSKVVDTEGSQLIFDWILSLPNASF